MFSNIDFIWAQCGFYAIEDFTVYASVMYTDSLLQLIIKIVRYIFEGESPEPLQGIYPVKMF
jgi:hypothetical protein